MMQFLKESLHYIYLNKTRNNMIFDFNIHLPYLNNQDVNKVVEHDLKLNQQELITGFEKHKIIRIMPEEGDVFDPLIHQAMFEAPLPESKAGEIIQVMAVGFKIGDRLLRPAQVGVSSNPG